MSGRYQVAVWRGGEMVAHTPWFDNLITDGGLDRIGIGPYLTWCVLGTGTAAVSYTDTGLTLLQASSNNLVSQATSAGWHQRVWRFPAGEAAGLLTEVGVGWDAEDSSSSSSDGVSLFSHALIPEPLPVGTSEIVTVTYELMLHPPDQDDVYQLVLRDGVLTTCTARAAYVGDAVDWGISGEAIAYAAGEDLAPLIYEGQIGAATAGPSGESASRSSVVARVYIPGTHYLEQEGRWNLDRGNFEDGIGAMLARTNGYGAYQIGFDPPLDKICYDTLKLVSRVSWWRLLGSSSSTSSSSS